MGKALLKFCKGTTHGINLQAKGCDFNVWGEANVQPSIYVSCTVQLTAYTDQCCAFKRLSIQC